MKASELKERYDKVKEEKNPTKKFKKLTADDEVPLTQLMRKDVSSIEETLLGKPREQKIKADNVSLLNMVVSKKKAQRKQWG